MEKFLVDSLYLVAPFVILVHIWEHVSSGT
jgi:hypothetical protein